MPYVTGKSFLEAVDGSRSLFTAQEPFDPDSLEVFQHSLSIPPDAFIEVDTLRVRFLLAASRQTWNYSATANTISCPGHAIPADTLVAVWSTVSGGLPSGLLRSSLYYVQVVDEDNIQLALTAGGAAIAFAQSASGILYLAEPEAPVVADGDLYYNCVTLGDTVDGSTVIGFWNLSAFQAQYASGVALATLQDVLLDTDEIIQVYTTAASYALALTGVSPYRLFRRVQGELAYRLLANRPNLTKSVKSSEKEYADSVKRMKQTYNGTTSPLLKFSLEQILSQLIEYKRPDSDADSTVSSYLDCWGTGRFFGLTENAQDTLIIYP
jgi:hypothetical protein